MTGTTQPTFRRGARVSGWIAFAAFEAIIFLLVRIAASIRCCVSTAGPAPQSASEWVALGLFAALMLLLGAAVGLGAALSAEGLLRLLDRLIRRRRSDR